MENRKIGNSTIYKAKGYSTETGNTGFEEVHTKLGLKRVSICPGYEHMHSIWGSKEKSIRDFKEEKRVGGHLALGGNIWIAPIPLPCAPGSSGHHDGCANIAFSLLTFSRYG